MSGVVVDLEHDGTVELPGRILAELQLDQTLRVQRLPGAGVHFVLLDEGQDIEQVKHMTLHTKKKSSTEFLLRLTSPLHHNMDWRKAAD